MLPRLCPVLSAIALLLVGCEERPGGYRAAESISRDGFARDGTVSLAAEGQAIRLWGWVDPGNLYGDAGARQVLGEWWSGEGSGAGVWRFNLKARPDDATGHSFPVQVRNGPGRDGLLAAFVRDARAGRPTRVFLTGRLHTYPAPTGARSLTGLYLEVESSQNIRVGRPEQEASPLMTIPSAGTRP